MATGTWCRKHQGFVRSEGDGVGTARAGQECGGRASDIQTAATPGTSAKWVSRYQRRCAVVAMRGERGLPRRKNGTVLPSETALMVALSLSLMCQGSKQTLGMALLGLQAPLCSPLCPHTTQHHTPQSSRHGTDDARRLSRTRPSLVAVHRRSEDFLPKQTHGHPISTAVSGG